MAAGGGENLNIIFNHPSLQWRHTPRLGREKKKACWSYAPRRSVRWVRGYKRLADCVVTPRQPTRSHQGQRFSETPRRHHNAPSRNRGFPCVFSTWQSWSTSVSSCPAESCGLQVAGWTHTNHGRAASARFLKTYFPE